MVRNTSKETEEEGDKNVKRGSKPKKTAESRREDFALLRQPTLPSLTNYHNIV